MKTKRRTAEVGNLPGFKKSPEEQIREEAAEAASETGKTRERFQLSFDLNEDGSPDLSSMRGKTKERVQQFFSDPRMASAFGAKAPAASEVQVFHPAMIAGMYSMLGSIEAMTVARLAKIPEPIAKKVFTYTPQEIESLTPVTCRVLNKYAAEWMIKYQDEIALASMLVGLTVTKVNAAMILRKMQTVNIAPNGGQAKSEENGKKEGDGTTAPN